MSLRKSLLLVAVASVVLAGVFLMYSQPDFMVQMANQMWACF
ncbi:MAG: hypothetical protein WCH60_05775 [Burkholderiales bacterium]